MREFVTFYKPDGTVGFTVMSGGSVILDGVERQVVGLDGRNALIGEREWDVDEFSATHSGVKAGSGLLRLAPSEAVEYDRRGQNRKVSFFGIEGEFLETKIQRETLPLNRYYYELQETAGGLWVCKDAYIHFAGSVVLNRPLEINGWSRLVPDGALVFTGQSEGKRGNRNGKQKVA